MEQKKIEIAKIGVDAMQSIGDRNIRSEADQRKWKNICQRTMRFAIEIACRPNKIIGGQVKLKE